MLIMRKKKKTTKISRRELKRNTLINFYFSFGSGSICANNSEKNDIPCNFFVSYWVSVDFVLTVFCFCVLKLFEGEFNERSHDNSWSRNFDHKTAVIHGRWFPLAPRNP